MKIDSYDVRAIVFGHFRLDGGAMFGSVPKNIWSKLIPADDQNCIKLAARCLLIKGEGKTILIDVGLGEKYSDKARQIFGINNVPREALGLDFKSVTHVILTHLHFDHAGGISEYATDDRSKLCLTFPNAEVFLQSENLRTATNPNIRERASYLKENIEILTEGNLTLVDGSQEIIPKIWVHRVDGHTKGQQWVEIRGEKEVLMYPTDLIPTSKHLPIPYHMGYDMCPETILREREDFLKYAVDRNAVVVFEHDPEVTAVRVHMGDNGHYGVKTVVAL